MASRMTNRKLRASQSEPAASAEAADQELEEQEQLDDEATEAEVEDVPEQTARDLTAVHSSKLARRSFEERWLPRWVPSYLRNAVIELSKVVWPTRQEAVNVTIVVLVMAISFAVVFGLLDLGFVNLLQAIIKHAQ